MQRLNLNRVLSKFAERTPQVVAQVNDFEVLTPTLARVIVTLNTSTADRTVMHHAIAAAFDGDLSPVEGSFRAIASKGAPAMHGFVTVNAAVRPYDDAAEKGMVAVNANLLMDSADQSLWNVSTSADGTKMLTRSHEENLSELMTTARVHMHNAPCLAHMLDQHAPGEYAAYVDKNTNEVRFGYILASDGEGEAVEVLPNVVTDNMETDNQREPGENKVAERLAQGTEPVIVDVAFLVETARLVEADKERFEGAAVNLPADSKSKESMKSYYKELYSYDPAYYAMIEKEINEHAAV